MSTASSSRRVQKKSQVRRRKRERHGFGAGLTTLAGVAMLIVVIGLAVRTGYDGVRGLHPYTIDGIEYLPGEPPDYAAIGIASWYGDPFHGRQTSNGEVYDQDDFTAAHKTLPLGTRVKVTNLNNGRATLLTINDRGPFVDGRIIDVSRRAARELGFAKDGLTQVRVEALYSPLR